MNRHEVLKKRHKFPDLDVTSINCLFHYVINKQQSKNKKYSHSNMIKNRKSV